MSKMVDDYFALLKRIGKQVSKEKLDPWVQKFGSIVGTGENEDIKSICNID